MSASLSDQASDLAVQILDAELNRSQSSRGPSNDRIQQLEAMRGLVSDATELADSLQRIVDSTVGLVKLGITVEAELRKVTLETTARRERLAAVAPGTIQLLQDMSARIDALVERATAIDPRRCTEAEIRWRNRLLDLAQKQSDSLNDRLMQLLSS